MSEEDQSRVLESLDENRTGLRLVFSWIGDRFGHRVERLVEGEVVGTWHSVESDSSAAWPLSPPLQQLSIEPIEESPVAFGVGSAGVSYWSLAVSPVVRNNSPALCFDVALKYPKNSDSRSIVPISTYKRSGEPASAIPNNEGSGTTLFEEGERLQIRATHDERNQIRWAYVFT